MKEMREMTKEQMDEDADLMRRVVAGADGAFDEFSGRFQALIYSTVYQVINDVEDARDLTQEVLVTLWKKSSVWQPSKGKLPTWICAIARNRAIDRIRGNRRRWAMTERVRAGREAEASDVFEETGSDRLCEEEIRRAVRKVVVELNEEQRAAIEMAYFEGLTQVEVARRTGVPLGTTKARIRRGVQKLRTIVRERIDSDFDFVESL